MKETIEMESRMTDHLNLYNKALTIVKRKGYTLFLLPVSMESQFMGVFVAEKEGRDFFAEDPLRLLGMITIWEEHGDQWYEAPKFPTERISDELMEESYPDLPNGYEDFSDERFKAFVKKCQHFFKQNYMPDIEIRDDISREELTIIMNDLQKDGDE